MTTVDLEDPARRGADLAEPSPQLPGALPANRRRLGAVQVVRTRAELDAVRNGLTGRVVLVPTMGALHGGHRALIRAARALGEHVIVSIFVNPTQFGAGEDLHRYPRTPWADLDICTDEGVAVVFMPETDEVYGPGLGIRVDGTELANRMEGAVRPGHFSGVLTVVAKLFGMVAPAAAVFGEKDYQQLVLIRAMSRELALRVEVHSIPTVRDTDGMALSSRNRYLDGHQRVVARALSRALRAGATAAVHGRSSVLAAAQEVLDAEPELTVDYLALTDPQLGPAQESGPARLLVAARLGTTRLIDNVAVTLGTDR
jgi:pantoate--beta-alanine ligase